MEHVDVAALELGDRSTRLGDDARLERLGLWRAQEVAVVARKEEVVVVTPVDESPWSRSDRTLTEIRGDVRGNDRGDRHREQLHECRERLLECDDDRAVVADGQTRDALCFLGMEVPRSLDRVEELAGRAFCGWIERALPAGDHVVRDEGTAVVKVDVAAQVERVGPPVGCDVPPFSEPGLDLRGGSEARESVEDVADGTPGRHVSRECGIERPWVIVVARVDERATIGRRVAAEARTQRRAEAEEQVTAHAAGR